MKKDKDAAVPPQDPADKTPVDLDVLPERVRNALVLLKQWAAKAAWLGDPPAISVIAEYMADQEKRIVGLLKPLEFEASPGRPPLLIKLGCAGKGWIPSEPHFDRVRKFVKASGLDKTHNVLLFNYAIGFERLDS